MRKKFKKIKVIIDDKDEIFNTFDNDKLSSDLGDYIYEEYHDIKESDSVTIEFYTKINLSEKEKEDIIRMIRNYFKLQINKTNEFNKYDNIKKLVSFLVGVLIIFVSDLLLYKAHHFFAEILSIVGSVAIWGVFDDVINVILSKRRNKFKLNKLIKSKVVFHDM